MIGEVLSSEATTEGLSNVREVKVDLGGGDIRTTQLFSASGDDSPPLPLDQGVLTTTPGAGRYAVVGFVDPLNAPEASPGERRLYSRSIIGVVMAWIHLKSDGSIDINAPGGVTINGVSIDALGSLSAPGEVTAMSDLAPVNLSTHQTPGPFGPQGPPIANT